MPRFSRSQAQIAKALGEGAKTPKELRDELNIPLGEIERELAGLIKLKLVAKGEGFPTKYSLADPVRRGLMEESKKDTSEYPFKAHIIVEGQAKEKKDLERATQELIGRLKADKVLGVSNVQEDEITEEENGIFSNLFEADIAAETFEDMAYCVMTYGPSSIELESPKNWDLKQSEAQSVLMDIASILQAYVQSLVQKDLQVQELRKNSKEIFIT